MDKLLLFGKNLSILCSYEHNTYPSFDCPHCTGWQTDAPAKAAFDN
jgi:hypothetical protein